MDHSMTLKLDTSMSENEQQSDNTPNKGFSKLNQALKSWQLNEILVAYNKFGSLARSTQSMKEYVLKFEQLYSEMYNLGLGLSDAFLACKLLDAADLSESEQLLVLSSCADLNFEGMKSLLVKIGGNDMDVDVSELLDASIERPTQKMKYEDVEADRKAKSIFDEVLEDDNANDKDVQEVSSVLLKAPSVSAIGTTAASKSVLTAVQPTALSRTKSVESLQANLNFGKGIAEKTSLTAKSNQSTLPGVSTLSQATSGPLQSVTASTEKSDKPVPSFNFGSVLSTLASAPKQTTATSCSTTAVPSSTLVNSTSNAPVSGLLSILSKGPTVSTAPSQTTISSASATRTQPSLQFGLTGGPNTTATTNVFTSNAANVTNQTSLPSFGGGETKLGAVTASTATGVTKPTFNFGTTTADKIAQAPKTKFSFGSSSTSGTKQVAASFQFGTPKTEAKPTTSTPFGFKMQQQGSSTTKASTFQFGAAKSEVTPQMSVTTPFNQAASSTLQKPPPSFNFNAQQPSAANQLGSTGAQPSKLSSTNVPTFSFGAGSGNSQQPTQTNPSVFKFGAANSQTAQQPSTSSTPFKFGSNQSTSSGSGQASTGFNFGAGNPQTTQPNTTPFKFGAQQQHQQEAKPPAFKFGANTSTQPAMSFNFGNTQPPVGQPNPAQSFSFGANAQNQSTPKQPSTFQFGSNNKPSTSGFTFGSTQPQPSANPAGNFNLQSMLQSGNSAAPTAPFQFPNPSQGINTSFGASSASPAPLQQNQNPNSFNMGTSPAPRRRAKATRRIRK